jgi:hypothetical protein
VRGWLLWLSFSANTIDHFEDTLEIVVYLGVPEAQDLPPVPLKVLGPSFVTGPLTEMRLTVHLKDELALATCHVHNEPPDRVLTPELEPSEDPIPEVLPQNAFGGSQFATEAARLLATVRVA